MDNFENARDFSQEKERGRIEWVEKSGGNYGSVVVMKFPSGRTYGYREYQALVFEHLNEGGPLEDMLNKDDLMSMVGSGLSATEDIGWLELADKYYHDEIESFYQVFEKSLKTRALGVNITNLAVGESSKEFDWDEQYGWFDLINAENLNEPERTEKLKILGTQNTVFTKRVTEIL
ncbi:MAG: hypothetical protein HYV68_03365 [Candidatus Taylorbacteria bacterium]|nr:hypothetical protein [Candidatus Taylorbacteria bacterium]